jgi:hypothetical protein
MMPQAWKISRYQLPVFHHEPNWRKPLHRLFSVLWVLFLGAVALWILAGGSESRQLIASAFRALAQFFHDAFSGLAWLFR